jgi:hypothetical protein
MRFLSLFALAVVVSLSFNVAKSEAFGGRRAVVVYAPVAPVYYYHSAPAWHVQPHCETPVTTVVEQPRVVVEPQWFYTDGCCGHRRVVRYGWRGW